ncbi:MAG: RNA polymerase-binding protein DksA [Deltaproteobacteria bacterium]|nr:RNA polymerase-binding protein DksA [Deltaproteobacteria bacterium]
MNKKDIARFKKLLTERRQVILDIINNVKEQGLGFSVDDLPDEIDLASSESDQSMNLRLRDRERVLLKKIDRTLEKMEEGTFGVCETCGEEISVKRLEARPVTDLCIRCKEEQERIEKGYAD